VIRRWLAGQFARPSGWLGRRLIGPWLDRIGATMNAFVLAQLAPEGDDDLLEIGFGGGDLIARALRVTDGRITGIDVSDAMVKRASRRFRREIASGRVRLLRGSVEATSLPDSAVDRACSVNNIYFWPDPAAGMAELARVVRPGGRLAIAFEPPEELRKWPGHRHGFRLFEEAEVRALMDKAGFGDLRVAEGRGRRPDRFLCLTGTRRAAERAA
jgi:arsenite methyltransferase